MAPAGLVGEFFGEHDLTAAKLLSLFKQAFVSVEVMEGPRLRMTAESGVRMTASVDAERQLNGFPAIYGLREDAPFNGKLEFINRVNRRMIIVRLSVLDATNLCCDHELPFDGGVTAASVIGAMRRLARITRQAIVDLDTEKVVA